jgi:anti-sigma-K factor RskA
MSTDVHTLSGAYALNALAPDEAQEFRRHLDVCQACRDEVRELQTAVAAMGLAEASAPPPELKTRVLAAADRTRQEPPRQQAPVAAGVPAGPARRSWVTWLAAAAAAVVIAGAGVVGIRAVVGNDEVGKQPALADSVLQVFEADDAHTATVSTANGGKLTVAVSKSRDEMAVDTRQLPPLDSRHVYQIWAVHGDDMVSAAILSDPQSGAAMGMPNAATDVALTVEPSGGSERPTTAPIVEVDPYDVLGS